MHCKALTCILFCAAVVGSVQGAQVFGLKSRGIAGTADPRPPTHVYLFEEDATKFFDFGALTLSENEIVADGLALSRVHGLLAFLIDGTTSTLIEVEVEVDTASAKATIVGQPLTGRRIFGAAFDADDHLWTLDHAGSELFEVDPLTGLMIGSPIQLNRNQQPIVISEITDIAFRSDGTLITSVRNTQGSAEFFEVNTTNGELTFLRDLGTRSAFAGLAYSQIDPNTLFGFEVTGFDQILTLDTNFSQVENVFGTIITDFNAGGGDLANLTVRSGDVNGDFDRSGILDIADIDLLTDEILEQTNNAGFDLNADGLVDQEDSRIWVEDLKMTFKGDANLDFVVDAKDLNTLAINWQQGQHLWSRGDFNSDGAVTSLDLNLIGLNWRQSALQALAVPEPGQAFVLWGLVVCCGFWRRGFFTNRTKS